MHAGAKHGIAEESGREVFQIAIAFLAHGMRRLLEEEELELRRSRNGKSHLGGPGEHAAQDAARADRFGVTVELAKEEWQIALERNEAHGFGQHAHGRVRIGRVPARERRVVIELIVRIPAEHHVAEAKALLERGFELVARHVLAAHDAVDVDDTDLDEGQVAAAQISCGLGSRVDGKRIH